MKSQHLSKIIRRSVALPREIIQEISSLEMSETSKNFNRLVIKALREYILYLKEKNFEKTMADMALDPSIQNECAVISKEFSTAEKDGLKEKI